MTTAAHMAKSPEHGTPTVVIRLAIQTLGYIDVDPATSATWNTRIGARRIFTKEISGLDNPWRDGAPNPKQLITGKRFPVPPLLRRSTRVFLNPPGEATGGYVALFWRTLAAYFEDGWVTDAVWVGFNIEQLARLQRVGAASHPLQHLTLVPAKRFQYVRLDQRTGESPPHSSFVTLLSRNSATRRRFAHLAGALGHVVNTDEERNNHG